ncbi:MAG: lipase, partial [Chloroflexi bacterium]|nr:lipase [Chloroflexota bacterium]
MNDIIFLLHGLGRSSWSMKRPEWWLARQGYTVFNLNYPSQKFAVKELAQWVDEKVALHNHDPARKI